MASKNIINRRIGSLTSHYLRLVFLFMLQKPLFMLYATPQGEHFSLYEWLKVILHGITIDLSVSAYLTIIPLLLIILAIWIKKLPIKRLWSIYDTLVAIVLAIIFVSDTILYTYWGFKLDASVFFYLRTPQEAIASVSLLTVVIGIAVIILIALLMRWFLIGAIKPIKEPFPTILLRTPVTFLYVVLLLPLVIIMRGGLKESTMNVGHAYFSTNQFLNHSAINPAFSLLSSMSKTSDYSQWYDYFEESKRSALFDGLYQSTDSCTTSLLKSERPNVLLCVLESFGGMFVNAISGTPHVTPCLDSLINQGVFFSNCYASSFRTDRGLVCIMNGHLGLPATSIMKLPAKSASLPSLPAKLSQEGYTTSFLYGGDVNFTNMKSWLYGTGFSHVTCDIDFTVAERHTNAWGVNDDITFKRLLHEIKECNDSLWFKTILSLSSHEPFEVPYHRLENKIYNAFAYTDSCLGALVDSLKCLPQWDNLLMIIVPDHGFKDMTQGINFDPTIHHIPVLWLGGAIKQPTVVQTLVSQSDLAATLLAQMGIDHSEFLFSRNVLSESYNYPFAYYTFSNGFCFIDSTGVTLYDDDASSCLIEDSYGATQRMEYGKSILQTAYDDLESR